MQDKNATQVLNEQLPKHVRSIVEFQEVLKAHGYLLQQIEAKAAHIRDNFYITTCDWKTVAYYEKLLGISGDRGFSLEERRAIVLMRYGMRPLYTLSMLKEMLKAAVGQDNYSVICISEKCQMTVILKEQDTGKIREIYDMVALIRPAHIELFFNAEYTGECELSAETAASVRFLTSFYPRFNLPRLCLNGSWKLDGTRRLSGYDSQETVDLYPVSAKFRAEASGTPEEDTQLRLRTSAGEGTEFGNRTVLSARYSAAYGMESGQGITLRSGTEEIVSEREAFRVRERIPEPLGSRAELSVAGRAECRVTPAEEAHIRASVLSAAGAGDITVYNENRVDGTFKLNGSRKLNGGTELR